MKLSFIGFQNRAKDSIYCIKRSSEYLVYHLEELEEKNEEDEENLECIFSELDVIEDFVDSVHNIVYSLLRQESEEKTLEEVKKAREFLGFDKEKWQPRKNCLVQIPQEEV